MEFSELLKEKSIRVTSQRIKVLEIICSLSDKSTINNIIYNCRNQIDKSTVYRILDTLVHNKVIYKTFNQTNNVTYKIVNHKSKCCTKCIKCGVINELDDTTIAQINKTINKSVTTHNFSITVDIVCIDCQKTT